MPVAARRETLAHVCVWARESGAGVRKGIRRSGEYERSLQRLNGRWAVEGTIKDWVPHDHSSTKTPRATTAEGGWIAYCFFRAFQQAIKVVFLSELVLSVSHKAVKNGILTARNRQGVAPESFCAFPDCGEVFGCGQRVL